MSLPWPVGSWLSPLYRARPEYIAIHHNPHPSLFSVHLRNYGPSLLGGVVKWGVCVFLRGVVKPSLCAFLGGVAKLCMYVCVHRGVTKPGVYMRVHPCEGALLARPEIWGVCAGIRPHHAGETGASPSAAAGPRAAGAAAVDSHGSCICKRRPYTFKCDEKPSEKPLF